MYAASMGETSSIASLACGKPTNAACPNSKGECLERWSTSFAHSYCNPLVEAHLGQLQASGDALFGLVHEQMGSQAYGSGETLLRESLVRACVIRYVREFDGAAAAQLAVQDEKDKGFYWMGEMSEALREYESHRELYPTMDAFMPRLAGLFAVWATIESQWDAKHPGVELGPTPTYVSKEKPDSAIGVQKLREWVQALNSQDKEALVRSKRLKFTWSQLQKKYPAGAQAADRQFELTRLESIDDDKSGREPLGAQDKKNLAAHVTPETVEIHAIGHGVYEILLEKEHVLFFGLHISSVI